jgi:hypothetical protein
MAAACLETGMTRPEIPVIAGPKPACCPDAYLAKDSPPGRGRSTPDVGRITAIEWVGRSYIRVGLLLAALLVGVALGVPTAGAQSGSTASAPSGDVQNTLAGFPDRELVVGTKEAPPFAMKGPDGNWTGISIDLWTQIAQKLGVKFRLVEEPSVQSLLDATSQGRYDLSVAAITITAERERNVDFSQPFYDTGLGIAVSVKSVSVWHEIIQTMTSFGFLQAAGALIGISLAVGALIWLLEHRHNEDFGGERAWRQHLVVCRGDDAGEHRPSRPEDARGTYPCDRLDGGLDHHDRGFYRQRYLRADDTSDTRPRQRCRGSADGARRRDHRLGDHRFP